jgi:hypothetical protein
MNTIVAALFLGLVTCVGFAPGCGGKVIVDGQTSESTSSSSSTSGVATGSTSSSAASSSGVGACESSTHTIAPAGYNLSCNVASDCTNVFFGDFCMGCVCAFSAINSIDLMKYQTEAQQKSAGAPPSACDCPASGVSCDQGVCTAHVP